MKYLAPVVAMLLGLNSHAQWWKQNNLRVIQTNLPAYEAATLDPDSLVKDLVYFSANTLIINAGGIMAFYPTRLDFQYVNPFMKAAMLGDVIQKPYWPYNASDNVNNASHSFPDHIVSNSSIQQISFQSRYNAIEPGEASIRLYENIANGSGLDISLMGDLRVYEDERNFPVPSGLPMQEYRGILLMLNEAHIPYDIIGDAQLGALASVIKKYRLLILPDISYLSAASTQVVRDAAMAGTNIIATNNSLSDDPGTLFRGAALAEPSH